MCGSSHHPLAGHIETVQEEPSTKHKYWTRLLRFHVLSCIDRHRQGATTSYWLLGYFPQLALQMWMCWINATNLRAKKKKVKVSENPQIIQKFAKSKQTPLRRWRQQVVQRRPHAMIWKLNANLKLNCQGFVIGADGRPSVPGPLAFICLVFSFFSARRDGLLMSLECSSLSTFKSSSSLTRCSAAH